MPYQYKREPLSDGEVTLSAMPMILSTRNLRFLIMVVRSGLWCKLQEGFS
jgi:hypothetical protein